MSNTAKRLPIVLCLDVSNSMNSRKEGGRSAIELLNLAVKEFVESLRNDVLVKTSAEVAVITFCEDTKTEGFKSINELEIPTLTTVKGRTHMGKAVIEAIHLIEKHREELDEMEISSYCPFLVLVTDGNPDKNDDDKLREESIKLVRSYCDTHVGAEEIIVPFVIGVGDNVDSETLNRYSEGFTSGYFPIRGTDALVAELFQEAFRFISDSARGSIHLNELPKQQVKTLKADINEALQKMVNKLTAI